MTIINHFRSHLDSNKWCIWVHHRNCSSQTAAAVERRRTSVSACSYVHHYSILWCLCFSTSSVTLVFLCTQLPLLCCSAIVSHWNNIPATCTCLFGHQKGHLHASIKSVSIMYDVLCSAMRQVQLMLYAVPLICEPHMSAYHFLLRQLQTSGWAHSSWPVRWPGLCGDWHSDQLWPAVLEPKLGWSSDQYWRPSWDGCCQIQKKFAPKSELNQLL